MSVGGRSGMAVIINIKLYPIPGKSAGILHHILHAVHHNLRPHRHKGIGGIHRYRMVCRRVCAAGRGSACPCATADGTVTIPARYHLPQRFPDTHGFCFRHRIIDFIHIQAVLLPEDFFHFIRHLAVSKFPVFCSEIGNQMIRVMRNLIYLIPVFIIPRMSGFHVVDLAV